MYNNKEIFKNAYEELRNIKRVQDMRGEFEISETNIAVGKYKYEVGEFKGTNEYAIKYEIMRCSGFRVFGEGHMFLISLSLYKNKEILFKCIIELGDYINSTQDNTCRFPADEKAINTCDYIINTYENLARKS